MRKNIVRMFMLGILIMACIGQTVKLWLGDMSSHNFFGSDYISYEESILYPKEIWSNVNKKIYKMDENNDENSMSFKILYELYSEIGKEELKVESGPKVSYEDLLSFRTGIIYNYGTRLSLEEIIGQNIKTAHNKSINSKVKTLYVDLSDLNSGNGTQAYVYLIDEVEEEGGLVLKVTHKLTINNKLKNIKTAHNKSINSKVKTLYVDLSDLNSGNGTQAYVYLIDEVEEEGGLALKVTHKLTINNKLKFNNKVIDHFKEVANDPDIKTYQSSLLTVNDSERFEGNVFYPVINEANPITYSQLRLLPLVEGIEDEELEPYINGILRNSKSQTMTILEDGATFSDNLHLSVKYSNVGTLEFNKTLKGEVTKSTPVEQMVSVTNFIANSEAIPRTLKKGLYLKEIQVSEELSETRYIFGYQYEGFDVTLSDEAKRQLNVSDFLEMTLRGKEVTSGKWVMLEVAPADVTNSSFYEFSTSVDQAIGEIITKAGMTVEGKEVTSGKWVMLEVAPADVTNSSFYEFSTSVDQAIGEIITKAGMTVEEGLRLRDLACVYRVEDIYKGIDLKWVGSYQFTEINTEILEIEKIDNG